MKILIISPSWIGDAIMSHSLYRLLVIKYQNQVKIDVITPIWCQPVIHRLIEVDTIFTAPYTHKTLKFIKCYNLGQLLKTIKYQQAIILPNSLKSSIIPWIAKIPIRTGWRGEVRYGFLNDLRILNTASFPLMVQRYAALAFDFNIVKHYSDLPDPLPLPQLHVKKTEIKNILHKFNLNKNKNPLIGLCPGSASGLVKCWPYYHYITLTIKLIYYGYHVVILGSYTELYIKKIIENDNTLKNLKQHYHDLIGKTSLNEATIILSACEGIVSNDSGLMHLACALKRPVIGMYGYFSNPHCTPPLFYKSKALYSNIITYNNNTNQKIKKNNNTHHYHDSLINITPQQVLETLTALLH